MIQIEPTKFVHLNNNFAVVWFIEVYKMKWEHHLLAQVMKSQNTLHICEAKCNRLQMCLFIKLLFINIKACWIDDTKDKTHAN